MHALRIIIDSSPTSSSKSAPKNSNEEKIKAFKLDKQNVSEVLIISYDLLRKYADELSTASNVRLLICDEGHRLKNSESQLFAALSKIKAKSRLVITATPIQNDMKEFFAIADFVNPGVLGTQEEFNRK